MLEIFISGLAGIGSDSVLDSQLFHFLKVVRAKLRKSGPTENWVDTFTADIVFLTDVLAELPALNVRFLFLCVFV